MTVSTDSYQLVNRILDTYQALRKKLSGMNQINWLISTKDMQAQLNNLVYRGFIQSTAIENLIHYPRYLAALDKRIEKMASAASRDASLIAQLSPLVSDWNKRVQLSQKQGKIDPRLEEIRWMIEELRVSLFAQELKTAYPVSLKRIGKRWKELGL